ncbi:MAG: hypothetical protein HQL26_09725 [Candidatus Omnitrophica bacterium]|nr:hypothetical protein [Candidatus Omnitrophota bacterium]
MNQTGGEMLEIKQKYTWFNGDLQYIERSPVEFDAISYYPNGRLKFRYLLRKGSLQGQCVVWFENGNKMIEEPYVRGRLHGIIRHWYENGILKSQRQYRFGFPHGICKEYSEDGSLISKTLSLRQTEIPDHLKYLLGLDAIEAKHIITVRNAEIRRILLEDLGYERFLQQLPHEVVHKDDEQELVSVNLQQEEEPIFLVKVKCPSTGAFYCLRVPPTMKTVKEAVAWTFEMTELEYNPLKET